MTIEEGKIPVWNALVIFLISITFYLIILIVSLYFGDFLYILFKFIYQKGFLVYFQEELLKKVLFSAMELSFWTC